MEEGKRQGGDEHGKKREEEEEEVEGGREEGESRQGERAEGGQMEGGGRAEDWWGTEQGKRQLLPSSDVPTGQAEAGSALFPLAKPPRGVKLLREKRAIYFEVELGHLWRRRDGVKDTQPQHAHGETLGGNNCLATPRYGHGLRDKNLLEDTGKCDDGNAGGGGRSGVRDDEISAVTARDEDITLEQRNAATTPLPELVDPPPRSTNIGREGWQTEGMEGIGNKSFYFENPPSSLIYPIQGVLLPVWPAAPARTYLRRCWLQGWSGRSLFENVVYLAGLGRWGQDFSRLEEVGEEIEKKVPQQEEVKETKEEIAAQPKNHHEDQAVKVVEDSNSSSSSSSSSGSSNTSNSDVTSSGGETGNESESETSAEDDGVINGCVGAVTDDGGGSVHAHEQVIAGLHLQGQDNDRVLDLDFVDEREDAGISESIDMGVEEVLKSFEWDEDMNGVISDDQDDLPDFNKRKGDDIGDDFLLEFDLPTKLPRTEGTDTVHDNKQFSAASVSRECNRPLGLDFPDQVTSPGSCGADLGPLDILQMEGSGELAQGDTLPWAVGPMPGEYNDSSFFLLFEADIGEPPDTQLNISPKSQLRQPLLDCNTEIPGIELDGQKLLNAETEKGLIAPMTPESGISVANQGMTMSMSDPRVCEAVIVCPPSYRAVKLPQPMAEGRPGSGGGSSSDVQFQYTPSEVVKTWMDECAKRKGYIYSAALPTSRDKGRKRTPKDILGHSQIAGSTERFQRRKIGLAERTAQITGTLQTRVASSVVGRQEAAEMAKLKQEHSNSSAEHGKIHSGKAVELDASQSLLEGGTNARQNDVKEVSNRLTKQKSNGGFSVGKTGPWEGVSRDGIVNSTDLATTPRPPAVASEIESMILFVRACERARVMLVQEMEKRERAAGGNLGGDNCPSVPSKEVFPLSHSGKGSGSAVEDAQIGKGWTQCNSEEELSRSVQGQAMVQMKVEIGEWRDVGEPARSSAQEPLAVGSQMLLARQVQDGLRSRGSGGASLGLGLGSSMGTAGIGLGMSGSGTGKLDGRPGPGIVKAEVGVRGMASNANVYPIDRNQSAASDPKSSSDHKVGARCLVQGAQQQAAWTASVGRGENVFGGRSSKVAHAGVPDGALGTAAAASPAAVGESERESSCWGDMVDAIPLLAQQALVVMDAGGLDGECGDGALPQLAVRSCIGKKMSGQGATGETSGVFIAIDELGDGADDIIPEVLEPLAAEVTAVMKKNLFVPVFCSTEFLSP
ncbi:hypothetical protein CBR_g38306 [Chara braunii]|uniref:Uncharacterized protein n=1 Tax=Chara braunii TaxID=69332 RepID=A0A388LQ15_CHABU|nr:hypothetical protein CBR_g38306 [Chara braunii]|eukprot:GBG84335.1 hypothetical protein CBR_g38306 [Chara braunii]